MTETPSDPYTHWRRRAETAEAEVVRLNMEMEAYRQKLTPKDVEAMTAVIKALQAEKDARKLPHASWFDGGYLGNGHCSFMWARNGSGACCVLAHGHEGPHREDSIPSGGNRCRVCDKEDCPRDHGP